jgi:tetratricopeptide (TPR) repeat protein
MSEDLPPRRVFISHTVELRRHGFVAAAEAGVTRAGGVLVAAVGDADVLLLIAGFHFGSPAEEFDSATEAGLSRLVFLLDENTLGPRDLHHDPRFGGRQDEFRARLVDGGLATHRVSSPAELETAVHRVMAELPRPRPAGRAWNIPARPARFTGRAELLASLWEALDGEGAAAVQALHGMIGVGKTTVALEYAHRHADDYDIAWWIPAETTTTLILDRLAELARALQLVTDTNGTDVAIVRLFAHLNERDRWLFVFDNAENWSDLRSFLPAGPGHVIITTRNPDWPGTPAEVQEFTRADSVQALRSQVPRLTDEDADRLARALGDLPQAVDRAATFLADTGMTEEISRALRFGRADEVLAMDPAQPTGSWSEAFGRLDDHDPIALELLTLLAWLAPEPVPLSWITDNPGQLPPDLAEMVIDSSKLADTLQEIQRRGLARVFSGSVHLHPVPAALLRARTQDEPDVPWSVVAAALLCAVAPAGPPSDPATWDRWHELVVHILIATDSDRDLRLIPQAVWLLRRVAGAFQAQGETGHARTLMWQAWQQFKTRLGEDHPDTLETADKALVLVSETGDLHIACVFRDDVLRRSRTVLGEDHQTTLAVANNLAADLFDAGRFDEARDLVEDALTRCRRTLGADHPHTITSATILGTGLLLAGDHEHARDLLEENLTRQRRILGVDHPGTLTTAANLAIALLAVGEPERARDLHEDTLARRRRILGDDHPDTLTTAENLARHLRELGDDDRARELEEFVQTMSQE